ncbi:MULTISPECIES: hypothetical protein [unclassified Nostoc]|uniref:hypothetical protein n=1 Tax=unclassified Nostoc TaxID=2593658 RepID=UPI001683165E|nr:MULTISPECIES: hypothetical protein [unclassified Nostoc]MBD2471459.1 hypothetical protein [Nostoc sp. FACHB-145]
MHNQGGQDAQRHLLQAGKPVQRSGSPTRIIKVSDMQTKCGLAYQFLEFTS